MSTTTKAERALERATLAHRNAVQRAEYLRGSRDAAIREAWARGMSATDIAKATGLTRQHVYQLARYTKVPA